MSANGKSVTRSSLLAPLARAAEILFKLHHTIRGFVHTR